MTDTSPIYGHIVRFKESIAFLRQKVAIPTKTWQEMQGMIHAKAFTVAGATKQQIADDFHSAVTEAQANGETLPQFRKRFDKITADHGWSYKGGRGWRSQTIYQNNKNTARAAGRWQQQERTK